MVERKKIFYCPVNGWDCPYWKPDGRCILEDPFYDCDDFASLWDEDDEYWIYEE